MTRSKRVKLDTPLSPTNGIIFNGMFLCTEVSVVFSQVDFIPIYCGKWGKVNKITSTDVISIGEPKYCST
jgi:hypothetical protein